jgi:hypothetical protein
MGGIWVYLRLTFFWANSDARGEKIRPKMLKNVYARFLSAWWTALRNEKRAAFLKTRKSQRVKIIFYSNQPVIYEWGREFTHNKLSVWWRVFEEEAGAQYKNDLWTKPAALTLLKWEWEHCTLKWGKKVLNISNEDCESGQHSRKVPLDKKWVSLINLWKEFNYEFERTLKIFQGILLMYSEKRI